MGCVWQIPRLTLAILFPARSLTMGSPCIHPGIIVAHCVVIFLIFCIGLYVHYQRRGRFSTGGFSGIGFVGMFVCLGLNCLCLGIAASLTVGLPLGLAC